MEYLKYQYIYPPRPENTTHPSTLSRYDNGTMVAQPKMNGTCCVVFMNETDLIVMNRHNGKITSDYTDVDFRGMYEDFVRQKYIRGGWLVLCGEMLNMNKKGEGGIPFNLKFVVWDILVLDSEYYVKSTLKHRLQLLELLFPCSRMYADDKQFIVFKHLCVTKYKNIFKVASYETGFMELWNDIVKTDVYEGMVLKRKDAPLTVGFTEKNNHSWQIKSRKKTLNYEF